MPSLLLLLIVYHEEKKHAIHLAALDAGEFWRKIVKSFALITMLHCDMFFVCTLLSE